MVKQAATKRNKPAKPAPIPTLDLTFGFPGKLPANIRHTQFIQEYVKLGEIQLAGKACGYSEGWYRVHGPKILKAHHDFVAWLQAQRAQEVVKVIELEDKQVLEEMVRIAFANEADFIVIEERVLDGEKVPVMRARRKRVDELTREQLSAVTVHRRGKDGVDWKFRDRDQMLMLLAKHTGMLNEKIIMEHRHRHLHMSFDLAGVSMADLEALEGQFEALLGHGDADK